MGLGSSQLPQLLRMLTRLGDTAWVVAAVAKATSLVCCEERQERLLVTTASSNKGVAKAISGHFLLVKLSLKNRRRDFQSRTATSDEENARATSDHVSLSNTVRLFCP